MRSVQYLFLVEVGFELSQTSVTGFQHLQVFRLIEATNNPNKMQLHTSTDSWLVESEHKSPDERERRAKQRETAAGGGR